MLAHQAWLMMDAVARTLGRLYLTKRNLLEWVPAAQAAYGVEHRLWTSYRNLREGVILALAASIPKILRVPNEVEFFASAGLDTNAVLGFGLIQLAGGLLLVLAGTRLGGAYVTAGVFLASAVMLLATGSVPLGLVSFLPVVMAGLVVVSTTRDTGDSPPTLDP